MGLRYLADAPSIVPADPDGRGAVALSMAAALTPDIIRAGASAAALLRAGWPRVAVEACIDDAEAIAFQLAAEARS